MPMRDGSGRLPLRELEHDLHRPVAFAMLPIFAFANAGLALDGIGFTMSLFIAGSPSSTAAEITSAAIGSLSS